MMRERNQPGSPCSWNYMANSLVNYSAGGDITSFTAKFSLRILPFTHKTNRSGLFKTMTTRLLFCPQSILMIVSTVRPKKSSFSIVRFYNDIAAKWIFFNNSSSTIYSFVQRQ